MKSKNEIIFDNWAEKVNARGQCVKWGSYDEDGFFDAGTIWWGDELKGSTIIKLSDSELRYRDKYQEFKFYADDYPTDEFGQKATFRRPPKCFISYMDKNESDGLELPEGLDDVPEEVFEDVFEDVEQFTDWGNLKYPNSFSFVYEDLDSDKTEWFWECYTYNPKLSKEEVINLMRKYWEEG